MAQEQQTKTVPATNDGASIAESTAGYRGGLARTLVRTLLIFTFIPLALTGAAFYWRTRALLQDQVVGQMRAQVAEQVSDVDLSIKSKQIRLDRLVRNTAFQSTAQSALSSGGIGIESLRSQMNDLVRSASLQGGRATFNEYFLMEPNGTIVLSSNPEWDEAELRSSPAFATLSRGDHASYMYHGLGPLYEDELVLLTVSQVRGPGAGGMGTMVGITESGELETILQNLSNPGTGAEALFVIEDGKLIGVDPYTSELTLVQPPAGQVTPIITQLNRMMGEPDPPPASVAFLAEDGIRYFGQVLWLESMHSGILYKISQNLALGALTSLLPFTVLVILASLAAMSLVLTLGSQRALRPLEDLADTATKFSAGDFSQRASARTRDEIGLLARSFNHMAGELSGLYRSLEERVEERTRQIRTTAEVTERITTTNLGELLNRTAQSLIEQFDYYQASVFLLDRTQRYAVLEASSGPAASDLLAAGQRLEVGSASIIGWVTANNQPRIAADLANDPLHMRHPLLPETRSEAGIPIRAGNTILGAIDIQSTEPRAFDPETVSMLQTLANQLAAALQNVTLAESSQADMQDLQRLSDASRTLFGARTRDHVLARAAEQVAAASFPALLLTVHGQELAPQGHPDTERAHIAGMLQALPVLESHLAEIRRFVGSGPVIAEPNSRELPLALLDFTRQVGHRSVAFLPITHREELAGLFVVGSPNRSLGSAMIEPYTYLAELVGICLDRLAETEGIKRRLVEHEALIKIGQALARSVGDSKTFFSELHTGIRDNIGEYDFVVALFDAIHETIRIPYAFRKGRVEKIDSLPLGEDLTSILVRTARPLLLADDVERRAESLGAKTEGLTARSWMGAPMLVEGKPIGVLIIQDLVHENAFTDHHLSFLTELAAQVALALENVRLLEETREQVGTEELLSKFSSHLSQSVSVDALLQTAVRELAALPEVARASIYIGPGSATGEQVAPPPKAGE